ncbi:MAG: DUF3082 domain-containing protein [Prochlorococcus sp.]|nr:DUF3082 domain-containing protein [Prochlorococcus sp.]MDP6193687.1 DUF3082 domain-containing protein [Prochlorococcaceae cyanobacterium ETNP18_MAG_1]
MSDDSTKRSMPEGEKASASATNSEGTPPPRKGPLSFLSGAMVSGAFAWLCLLLSQNLVTYFSLHTPSYSSAIAQSIASGFKTLVIGTSFLATFTFSFIGLGLTLVFFRSLFAGKEPDAA